MEIQIYYGAVYMTVGTNFVFLKWLPSYLLESKYSYIDLISGEVDLTGFPVGHDEIEEEFEGHGK